MTTEVTAFVEAFRRAIHCEIDAMRTRTGSSEVALTDGRLEEDAMVSFAISEVPRRLAPGDSCILRNGSVSVRGVVRRLGGGRIRLECSAPMDPTADSIKLVVTPWFLYERLIESLESVEQEPCSQALTLFGKRPPQRSSVPLLQDHSALNDSQRAAVALCSESNLSFVWGPPGTGKTTTLAHIASELIAQGKRILLAGATNAAIDQALARLADHAEMAEHFAGGAVIRVGESAVDTHGAALDEVVERRDSESARDLNQRLRQLADLAVLIDRGERLACVLSAQAAPQQSLFAEPEHRIDPIELAGLIPARLAVTEAEKPAAELVALLERRLARFGRLRSLLAKRASELRKRLRDGRLEAVRSARLVIATLANTYLSPVLADETFDVAIIEEASMAVLPTLFVAACRGEHKTIVVGDPNQLPAIVASDDAFARRAMGRNIFDVTVSDPQSSELVAMLDTQYRMEPTIGDLVGELFYGGRIKNGPITSARTGLSAAPPYAGEPVVVVDTSTRTRCERAKNSSSRVNPDAAEISADLARQAADGNRDASIAVITPYAAQARAIRERLGRRLASRIECSTIHRFQGQERDVVIIDLVDTAPMPPSKLLADDTSARLLNVSLSRAMGKLIIVADVDYFTTRMAGSVAANVLDTAIRRGRRRSA